MISFIASIGIYKRSDVVKQTNKKILGCDLLQLDVPVVLALKIAAWPFEPQAAPSAVCVFVLSQRVIVYCTHIQFFPPSQSLTFLLFFFFLWERLHWGGETVCEDGIQTDSVIILQDYDVADGF